MDYQAPVRFSLNFLVDLLYETGPQAAGLLYFGRTFGGKEKSIIIKIKTEGRKEQRKKS
jgi:hypothetical protein